MAGADRALAGRRGVAALALGASLLALVYGVFGPALATHHIDTPWYASFVHNWVAHGIEEDTLFGAPPQQGGGTRLFGKIFAFASGALFSLAGWTTGVARAISTLWWASAAALWYAAARRLGLGARGALLFVALMALAKPFVYAATTFRPEPFLLLLSAATVLLAVTGREGAAAFTAACAVEVHPVGVVALVFLAGTAVHLRGRPRPPARAMRVAAGLAAGAALYAGLHHAHLGLLASTVSEGGSSGLGRFFAVSYFASPGPFRHRLAEVPLLATAAALLLRPHLRYALPGAAALALSAVAFMVLPLRGNYHYLVLALPPLLLLIAAAAERAGRQAAALALACCWYLPIYAAAFAVGREERAGRGQYLAAVARAVPDDGLPVFGSPEEWWALRDRRYHVAHAGRGRLPAGVPALYLIDRPALLTRYHLALPASMEAALRDPARCRTVARLPAGGEEARVVRLDFRRRRASGRGGGEDR